MTPNIDFFGKGDHVNVTHRDGDMFPRDFTGTITEVRSDTILVEDQDGDCWEVESNQISFCSDKYFH